MMNIDRYRIPFSPLGKLECVELLDFKDYPILCVEHDSEGREFLSYLVQYLDDGTEQRMMISISALRLLAVRMGEMSISKAFLSSESGVVYVLNINPISGDVRESFAIPSYDFMNVNPIPAAFVIGRHGPTICGFFGRNLKSTDIAPVAESVKHRTAMHVAKTVGRQRMRRSVR
jgi:hypothetical protein